MNRLDPRREQLVAELAREGYSDYAILEATGVARTTIWRLRKKHGIPPHTKLLGRGNAKRVPRSRWMVAKPRAVAPESYDIRAHWLSVDKTLRSA